MSLDINNVTSMKEIGKIASFKMASRKKINTSITLTQEVKDFFIRAGILNNSAKVILQFVTCNTHICSTKLCSILLCSNKYLERATRKYSCFLNQENLFKPVMLSFHPVSVAGLISNNSKICISGFIHWNTDKR